MENNQQYQAGRCGSGRYVVKEGQLLVEMFGPCLPGSKWGAVQFVKEIHKKIKILFLDVFIMLKLFSCPLEQP